MNKNDNKELSDLADKNIKLFLLMNNWTRLLQDKRTVADYFKKNNYYSISIYGYGYVGETLERELKNTGIKIEYIIDKNAEYMYAATKLITPEEEFENVDVVVVTAIDNNNTLINELQSKCSFNIVSIGDVLKEAWKGDI